MELNERPFNQPINRWAEEDKPREKLLLKGKSVLSNAELLAILIRSGNKYQSAVDLSKEILDSVSNNLIELSRLSVSDLLKFNGIGEAKALAIVSALELGRRRRGSEILKKEKIGCSHDVFVIFHSLMEGAQYECFWILILNRSNKVISKVQISDGGMSGTVADPKRIFKICLEQSACGIILCHNHPSGNVKPSDADLKLTKKIKNAGDFLDVHVLDHIIIGGETYFSFADEGLI